MQFAPIPLTELQHNITIKTLVGNENKKEYATHVVENVALQRKTIRTQASNGEILYKAGWMLFIDAINSKYSSIDIFKEGSEIIFGDDNKLITTIDIVDPGNKLHHLEVTCV